MMKSIESEPLISNDQSCFAAGTLVHTKDGLKAIEDIQVNDWVLSQPEDTGEKAYKRVVRTIRHEDKAVYRIRCGKIINGEFISQEFIVTGSHPFYVAGQHREEWWDDDSWASIPKYVGWRRADFLSNLDMLLMADGETMQVSSVDQIWRTSSERVGWIAAGRDAEIGFKLDLRGAEPVLGEKSYSEYMGIGTFGIRHESAELEDEWAYKCTVYNFEVEDFHTYYVGKSGVWVHNTCEILESDLHDLEN